jgi:DNA replication and repair protein RecF
VRILSLILERFRSYDTCSLDLSQGDIHLLTGPNGAGKTNVIEAVSILSESRSCLGRDEEEIVRWGESYYRVRAEVQSDAGEMASLEVVSESNPRKRRAFFIRDVRVSAQQFIASLPTIVFLPQELALFSGPPADRRRLLDRSLGQIAPEYRSAQDVYTKALKQRSALLRNIVQSTGRREDLGIWNAILAHEGAVITLRRLELLEMLQCTLRDELLRLGEDWPTAVFTYERKGIERSLAAIEQELLQALEHWTERDILLQSTTIGPHRDDWGIAVDDRSLPSFASRGQQRAAVLALLFLLGSYTELQRGEKPVIILDDVFSELDTGHQEALLSSFAGHQVIMTATHIPEGMPQDALVWNVGEGAIVQSKNVAHR